MKRTYLDWAAAAPIAPVAARAFANALTTFGNPSSPHTEGRAARSLLDDARTRLARLASVKSDSVIFTGGATEANALGTIGAIRALWDAGTEPSQMHVLYLPSAHASTRGCMDELASWGVMTESLVLTEGAVDLIALAGQVRKETRLVALEAVCGETGTRFDTRGVRQILDGKSKEYGTRVLMHVDASQLPLVESFERTRLSADTLSLDAQKVGGVRGVGALIAPRNVALAPLIRGGGQERELRPGTEATASISAFVAALEVANEMHGSFLANARLLRERLIETLARTIPDMHVNGGKQTVPHIVNVSLPGRDTDYLVALLDEAGFAVSTRSACATNEEGSRAVLAMTSDQERAQSTLRVSWGPTTQPRDLERFAEALVRAVRFLDATRL